MHICLCVNIYIYIYIYDIQIFSAVLRFFDSRYSQFHVGLKTTTLGFSFRCSPYWASEPDTRMILMIINQTEGEDVSKGTRLLYPKTVKSLVKVKNKQKISKNDVIWVNTRWRFLPPDLKIKIITQVNLLRRESTHNLSLKAEEEAKAKDKFKTFYSKLVPFVNL